MDSGRSHPDETDAGDEREHARPSLQVETLDSVEAVEYSPDAGTYRATYDRRLDPPSEVVVATVAAVAGRSPLELEPLNAVIDPDALDALFAPSPSGFRRGGPVTFTFDGHEVTLDGDGVIEVASGGRDERSGSDLPHG